jgi:phage terminase small subunit
MTEEITEGSEPLKGRQETFVQLYAEGDKSAAEAYRQAGYSKVGARANSTRLIAKDSTKARIAHIKAKMAEKAKVTREKLAAEYNEALEIARSQNNAAAMVAATSGRARLFGLDKQTIVNEDHSQLTAEEEQYHREYAAWRLDQERKANIRKIG